MEAKKKEKLPNLKICIDNTESDDEKYDTLSIHDNDELDVDVDSDENFGSDNEKVEFNIRLGNVPKSKTPVSVSSRIVERKSDEGEYSSTSSDAENVEFNVRLGNVPKRRPNSKAFEKPERRYENKSGEFVTGIDVTGKNEVKKKYERAKRFGLEMKKKNHGLDLAGLYHSLGINEKKLNQDHRGIRLEAIHFRGTDTMHTKDVFGYFADYGPGNVEWIDDQSCNVVWQEPLTAARAMLNLSKSYDSLMKESDGSSNDERSDTEENPNKTENSVKKKKQKKKRIKRDSSSSSSSDSSSSDEDDGNKKQKKKKSETKTKEKVKVADKMKVDKNMKDEQNKKLAKSSEKSVDNNRKEEKMEEEEDVLDLMDDDDKDKVVNESGDTEKKAESVNKENTQTGSTDKKSSRKSRKDKSSKPKKSRKASSSSSSSGSSSSRSSSSSSSSRSGSSSSGSSSSSSSSSSSGSSNSSSSSSSDEEEPKKTGAKSEKKEKEKEKVPQKKTKEKKSKPTKKKVLSIPWPPGKWRFGNSHSKAKYLFLRYATKADKKLPGAEKRSKFYQKYGNPNFGGAKGLISSSRKRKFRAEVNREEMAEARAVVKAQRATITYDDFDIFGDETASIKMETDIEEFGATVPIKKRAEDRLGAVENTDIETGEFEEGEIIESEGDVPKQPEIDDFNDDLDLTEDKKEFEVDEEAAMMEQELNILLASPPRKRSMRMYADDMEDEIVAKRSSKIESSDPPRTDSSRPDSSRPRDARSLIIGKSFETKPDRSSASDLRNKLKRNRKSPYERYSSYDRHHKMRIEVRD